MIKKEKGIVLSGIDYSDSSRIIRIFTEKSGIVSLVAKGVRKPKSRLRGNVESLSYIEFTYYEKEKRELGVLKEANIIEPFLQVKEDLRLLNIAYGIGFILQHIPHSYRSIFRIALKSLEVLEKKKSEEVVFYFLLYLYKSEGVFPEIKKCVVCGNKNTEFLSLKEGGLKCRNCYSEGDIMLGEWYEIFKCVLKGKLSNCTHYSKKEKEKLLQILIDYGVYHLGDWVTRLRNILPSFNSA